MFKQGMWVARMGDGDPRRPPIGRVREVHDDGSLDIVLYAHDGSRIGRSSPSCGGPRGYEPCCASDLWSPIEEPNFKRLGLEFFWGLHLRRLTPDSVDQTNHG